MVTVINLKRKSLPIYEKRIEALSADSQRKWGSMSVEAMLAHLLRTTEFSLGEVQGEDLSNFFTRAGGYFVFRHMPWPKGRIKTFDSMLPKPEGDVDALKKELSDALERFVEALEENPSRRTISPLLGPTRLARWALVHGRHMDHHLTQFGV